MQLKNNEGLCCQGIPYNEQNAYGLLEWTFEKGNFRLGHRCLRKDQSGKGYVAIITEVEKW